MEKEKRVGTFENQQQSFSKNKRITNLSKDRSFFTNIKTLLKKHLDNNQFTKEWDEICFFAHIRWVI